MDHFITVTVINLNQVLFTATFLKDQPYFARDNMSIKLKMKPVFSSLEKN